MSILPRALWVAYALTDTSTVQNMIPSHLRLAPVAPLVGMPDEVMLFFNAYAVQSRWMQGHRVDVQTYARDVSTGAPHLVVLDVLSDTMDWNPGDGIRPANARVTTTDADSVEDGIDVHFSTVEGSTSFRIAGTPSASRHLDYDFAVRANRKCYFRNFPKGYKLSFDADNVMRPVRELDDVTVVNSLWTDLIDPRHRTAFMHEQAMEFDVSINPFELEYKKLPPLR
jgi:hypothetical protein